MYTIESALNEYSNNKGYYNRNLACYLKISQKWTSIIGESLSSISLPSFFINGVLTINVIDSIWAYEISMKKLSIFDNIKKETNIIVTELRTRIDEEYFNNIKNFDSNNIQKNNISDKHIEWINSVLVESNIKDKKLESLFYNVLVNLEER